MTAAPGTAVWFAQHESRLAWRGWLAMLTAGRRERLWKVAIGVGVFVIVTVPADGDVPVPDAPYSFGVLEMAQALGDFQSLDRAERRAAHVHLPDRRPETFVRLAGLLGISIA